MPSLAAYGTNPTGYLTDIQQAQSYGIDGFVVDMFFWNTLWKGYLADLFTAVAGTNFKLFVAVDWNNGVGGDYVGLGALLTLYAGSPNNFHYNGRPMVGGYADAIDPVTGNAANTWWAAMLADGAAFNPYFVPAFNLTGFSADQPPTTYSDYKRNINGGWLKTTLNGIMGFGGFMPQLQLQDVAASAPIMQSNGAIMFASVSSWWSQIRFIWNATAGSFHEFHGGEGLSTIWQDIINHIKPPFVALITWNDYTETYMGGASQSDLTTLATAQGWPIDDLFGHAGMTQLNSYFIKWYKAGIQPTPVIDEMFVFYRLAPMSVIATHPLATLPIAWNPQNNDPTLDDIYVTTICIAPATLRVINNGVTTDTAVAAGLVHTRVPFTAGAVEVLLIRGGSTLLDRVGTPILGALSYYYNTNPITYYDHT